MAPGALLDIALELALEAGRLLTEERPDVLRMTTKSSRTDVATHMDRASEDLLVAGILARRPHDGILGEEGGERPGTSGVRWILDPIDGTTNYVYDLPIWAVSVAAEVDGVVVAGVVEAPALGRRYFAALGDGAWEGDPGSPHRIRVTGETDLGLALVTTGFGYAAARREQQAEDLRILAPRVRDIRRLGAASLDLSWVGAGLLDASFESGLKPWDLAAGGLIASEAGAVVSGLHGRPAGESLAIASTPGIFDQLHDALAEMGAEE